MKEFLNKTVVITGGAGGIGTALAHHAAALNMNVVLSDVDIQALHRVKNSLQLDDSKVLTQVTDVADYSQVELLADVATKQFGSVDLLFNNAGIMLTGSFHSTPPDAYQKLIQVNVLGIMHCTHVFMSRMLEQNTPAHIVNSASLGGLLSWPLMSLYGASKAAVISFTEAIHYELQSMSNCQLNIAVVCPGPVSTNIFKKVKHGQALQFDIEGADAASLMDAQLADYGMAPDALARQTFDAIVQNRYWIFTHPEFKPEYRRRCDALLNEDIPDATLSVYGA